MLQRKAGSDKVPGWKAEEVSAKGFGREFFHSRNDVFLLDVRRRIGSFQFIWGSISGCRVLSPVNRQHYPGRPCQFFIFWMVCLCVSGRTSPLKNCIHTVGSKIVVALRSNLYVASIPPQEGTPLFQQLWQLLSSVADLTRTPESLPRMV
ncbi:hypothetical protein U1Q18_028681 [Sarracenia purpurea var. burkii]